MSSDSTSLPLVSIISINYNYPDVTAEMLQSLREATYPNIEIIIVDNASTKGDASVLKEQFPEIVFISSDENLGFAGGNNLGIQKAKGKYIMLLNNDTEVEPGFLEPLVEILEKDPTIGAVSPKIHFYHTPNTFQYAGYTPLSQYTVRNGGIGYRELDKGQYDEDRETAFAHGAAMMVPMKVIKKVGMMTELYFLYYEELDWGQRIKDAGYKIYYAHQSKIFHKESIATGKASPLKIHYLNRSRIIFMRRNIHGITYLVSLLYLMCISIPKNILTFTIRREWKLLSAYFKAIRWHLKHPGAKSVNVNFDLK